MTAQLPPPLPESHSPARGSPMSSQTPAAPRAPALPTSTSALVSLVAGLLSWILLPVLAAIVAVIAGHIARGEIRRSAGALDGDGMAIAGLILGYAQLVLLVVGLITLMFILGGIAVLISSAQ